MTRDQTLTAKMSASFYVPGPYASDEPVEILRKYPFAQLVSGEIHATATPLLFEDSHGCMIGHIAFANPHAAKMRVEHEALAIYTGPRACITPRHYPERPSVLTWNYLIAHVRGQLIPVTRCEDTLSILQQTVDHFETAYAPPWRIEATQPGKVDELLQRIIAFRIRVEYITGATKLSQLQPAEDRKRIIEDLASQR